MVGSVTSAPSGGAAMRCHRSQCRSMTTGSLRKPWTKLCGHVFRLAGDAHRHVALQHLLEQDLQLQLGQPGADAAVDAEAERQVPPGVGPLDIEPFGIGKHALVAVARDVPHDDLVALFHLVAGDLGVFLRGAAHVRQRRLPADDFRHRGGDFRRVGLQLFPFGRIAVEGLDGARHGVAGGVVAADDEQDVIAGPLLELHVAHGVRMRHQRDEIVLGRQCLALRHQPVEVMRHVEQMLVPDEVGFRDERLFDVAAPVRPERQQMPVRPGEIEQDGEHAGGQLDRDFFHPVELFPIGQGVEQFRRAGAHRQRHAGDLAGAEGGSDDAALLAVAGPVHGDELRQVELVEQVDNGDAAEFMARRKDVGPGFDRLDVGVAAHRPIGAERAVRADNAPALRRAAGRTPAARHRARKGWRRSASISAIGTSPNTGGCICVAIVFPPQES